MTDSATDIFAALAHPTRRQILQDLKDGELAAGEIASRFSASGPTISRHLSVLRQAGLISERRDANPPPLRTIHTFGFSTPYMSTKKVL